MLLCMLADAAPTTHLPSLSVALVLAGVASALHAGARSQRERPLAAGDLEGAGLGEGLGEGDARKAHDVLFSQPNCLQGVPAAGRGGGRVAHTLLLKSIVCL